LHQRRHIPGHGGRVVDPARGGIDHRALVLAVIAAYAAPSGAAYQNDAVQLADIFLRGLPVGFELFFDPFECAPVIAGFLLHLGLGFADSYHGLPNLLRVQRVAFNSRGVPGCPLTRGLSQGSSWSGGSGSTLTTARADSISPR